MDNKGFTLIEILAVITILVILLILIVPKALDVIETSKNKSYTEQIKRIEAAANLYVTENHYEISNGVIVSLKDLADAGYVDLPMKNPLTGENFDAEGTEIVIVEESAGVYDYDVIVGTVANWPVLVLNGGTPVSVGCAAIGNYNDLGANVLDPLDANAETVFAQVLAKQVPGTYTLNYSYTSSIPKTVTKTRSVTITNTNMPTITIAGGVTHIDMNQGEAFTAPTATASDVCDGALTVDVVSNVNINVVGDYTVTYTATNSGSVQKVSTVTVTVDSNQPSLTLLGSNPATIACAASGNYIDPQADVTDPLNPAAPNINATTTLQKKNAGSFNLFYTYTNAAPKTATANRTVNITNANVPVITITGGVTLIDINVGDSFTAPTSTGTDTCEGTITVNVSSNVNVNVAGNYSVTYNAVNLGGVPAVTKTVTVHVNAPSSYNFEYTGAQQSLLIPTTGTWQITIWGAKGGSVNGNLEGYGGYAQGRIYLTSSTTIYIYVGGRGGTTSNYTGGLGGWNGGGRGGTVPSGSNNPYGGGGGGGSTDVRVGGTALANRVIVGAGGGGAGWYTGRVGGDAYGTTGGDGVAANGGYGGTPTAGGSASTGTYPGGAGSLGTGGLGYSSAGGMGGGGGGAGYYGGSAGANGNTSSSCGSGGAGGSYIGGVTNGVLMGADTGEDGNGTVNITYIGP